MSPKKDETSLAADLLHGYAEIGKFLGISERAAEWQAKQGNIPVTRMGRLVIGSKEALRRRFAPCEAAAS